MRYSLGNAGSGAGGGSSGSVMVLARRLNPDMRIPPRIGAGLVGCWGGAVEAFGGGSALGGGGGGGGTCRGAAWSFGSIPPTKFSLLLTLATASI